MILEVNVVVQIMREGAEYSCYQDLLLLLLLKYSFMRIILISPSPDSLLESTSNFAGKEIADSLSRRSRFRLQRKPLRPHLPRLHQQLRVKHIHAPGPHPISQPLPIHTLVHAHIHRRWVGRIGIDPAERHEVRVAAADDGLSEHFDAVVDVRFHLGGFGVGEGGEVVLFVDPLSDAFLMRRKGMC